jgi:twitching motility protein PilU
MLQSSRIADLIRKGDIAEIKTAMASSRDAGMQTFDQALHDLYQAGHISKEVAMAHADLANDLRMLLNYSDAKARNLSLDEQVPGHLGLRDGDDY